MWLNSGASTATSSSDEQLHPSSSPPSGSTPTNSVTRFPPPPNSLTNGKSTIRADAMWSYSSSTSSASTFTSSTDATTVSTNHGVIGSGNVHASSRFIWNRLAPEEEEREEEALPSYLSYLQPTFRPPTGRFGLGLAGEEDSGRRSTMSPHSFPFVPASATATQNLMESAPTNHAITSMSGSPLRTKSTVQVETKSKELAQALQEFIVSQIDEQSANANASKFHSSNSPARNFSCNCEPLKVRVTDLERQLQTLQAQMTVMMKGNASGLHPPVPPPLPSGVQQLQHHPPLPPTPSSGSQSPVGGGSLITDRVSTLEGRQSAFQSQLAQISKVLGVPVGKHGKNSQVKNLVQTLREEIDAKVQASAAELEASCTANAIEKVKEVVIKVTGEEVQRKMSEMSSPSTSSSTLSYDTVLSALAEEHEASLEKLSVYFEERLVQESKQRVGLESRIQSRFGEQEEWLQQLEGEFGSWHDTSSSVATQIRLIQNKISEMEEKWKSDQLKSTKQLASEQASITVNTTHSPTNGNTTTKKAKNGSTMSASSSPPTVSAAGQQTSGVSTDSLTRSVHQLQMQYKHFQSEYKTDITELRENLALMETWVKTTRQETRDLGKNAKGLKQLVEKLVRDTGSAEELLQQYVSTITHQVASVTRQYVSVRIRDNNRLIDATLRARVPSYVENETESFMLVRPEKKEADDDKHGSGVSFVLRDDDEEAIRKLLTTQLAATTVSTAGSTTTTSSVPPSTPV